MDKHVFTAKQKKLIGWAAIAIFLLLSAVVGWFVGRPLVRFASQPEQFRQWVDGHGLMGCAAYVGMVFLQVVVAVIPGEPLEISGGQGPVDQQPHGGHRQGGGKNQHCELVIFHAQSVASYGGGQHRRQAAHGTQQQPLAPGQVRQPCEVAQQVLGRARHGEHQPQQRRPLGGGLEERQLVQLVIAGVGLLIYRQVCRRHERSAEDDRPEKNT